MTNDHALFPLINTAPLLCESQVCPENFLLKAEERPQSQKLPKQSGTFNLATLRTFTNTKAFATRAFLPDVHGTTPFSRLVSGFSQAQIPADIAILRPAPAFAWQCSSVVATMPKRKLGADKDAQKYYAVRAGFIPGVYLTWPTCQAQIAGFRGAQYKSFLSREDAEAFVKGQNPVGASEEKTDKFYAVAVGNPPGIYTDWDTASKAIVGVKGPKYKKFGTITEAKEFMKIHTKARAALQQAQEADDDADQPPAKKARTSGVGATNGAASGTTSKGALTIYTDGSSLANGRTGARAGVGVFFGAGDKRNVSERLLGEPQTNQRAELTAILRALQLAPQKQAVLIVTDSKYSIQCVTEWYATWQRNGWKTREGEVKNRDLVAAVRKLIDARDKAGAETGFRWVKGHASDAGNIAADRLAVEGASRAA
ncbi:uncharacterized protein E0L32_008044 [Thyridium curvatum]|uniref:Ribonuclease H n=1 Tax=Thyridium curvatum TaxID=1093900 RepID=A0A507AU38_9PEZI|nr:uncharacterized protein E0L32_008044 [Thyridium curvatum]TPX11007.1 hypothetical protein E0L32_008044 [Thyridium curvatum]